MSKITSYADLKSRKKPNVKKVPIALDGEKADEFNNLRVAYDEAKQQSEYDLTNAENRAKANDLKAELDALKVSMEDEVVEFTFRSIGRKAYEDLTNDSQPTQEQVQKAKELGENNLSWNPDTFPPALVAASLVDPDFSKQDIEEIWSDPDWNEAELMALFFAALEANQTRKVVDLGKESGRTQDSEQS